MTQQKTFKRKVRARMEKTGESYTAARRQLLAADGGEVSVAADVAADFRPPMSDEAIRRGSGRAWDAWFAILDTWGARRRSHKEIARWLTDEHQVGGWWAQAVTVGYEQARGLRRKHERPGQGFEISATKTIAAPVERLYRAVTDAKERRRWLADDRLSERTKTAPKVARYDWDGGPSRVVAHFDAKDDGRSRIAIVHERLPDPETAEAMKAFWRLQVAALKEMLEA